MPHDHPIADAAQEFRRACSLYERVFSTPADYQIEQLPGGDPALVLSGWLWLFPAGVMGRWTVRVVLPPDAWFHRQPGLAKLVRFEAELPTMSAAFAQLAELEVRRLLIVATEDSSRERPVPRRGRGRRTAGR